VTRFDTGDQAGVTCRTFPCDRLSLAVRQFNEGHYFECHETLEDLWIEERSAIRDLYRGILQIGIGLLHWRNGNFKGACSLLRGGSTYVEPFSPVCRYIRVDTLLEAAGEFLGELEALGPERMTEISRDIVPRIEWVASEEGGR